MAKKSIVTLVSLLLAIIAAFLLSKHIGNKNQDTAQPEQTGIVDSKEQSITYFSKKGIKVLITEPNLSEPISSPLKVKGEIPGNWSFEASFPVRLLLDDGSILASQPAQLTGDWMTERYVPFEVNLIFETQKNETKGDLVFYKDNPSGLAENDDEIRVPINF